MILINNTNLSPLHHHSQPSKHYQIILILISKSLRFISLIFIIIKGRKITDHGREHPRRVESFQTRPQSQLPQTPLQNNLILLPTPAMHRKTILLSLPPQKTVLQTRYQQLHRRHRRTTLRTKTHLHHERTLQRSRHPRLPSQQIKQKKDVR